MKQNAFYLVAAVLCSACQAKTGSRACANGCVVDASRESAGGVLPGIDAPGLDASGDGTEANGIAHAEVLIAPEGGEIALGAARLLVPAGALKSFQLISVSARPSASDQADKDIVGDVYDFQPDGLTFAVPAILTIAHVDGDFGLRRDELVLADKNAGSPEWTGLDTWVTEDGIGALIGHFSGKGKSKGSKLFWVCGGQVCGRCQHCDSNTQTCDEDLLTALCYPPKVPGGTCDLSCVCPAPPPNCKDSNSSTCDCESCSPGKTLCNPGFIDASCSDLQSDLKHCGTCDIACSGDKTCVNGTCECQPGWEFCSYKCNDLKNDQNNCGGCGNACASGGCINGTCECGCTREQGICCNGGCCAPPATCNPNNPPGSGYSCTGPPN